MNFVKAADFKKGRRWVDLDKVETVAVEVEESGGDLDILSVLDGGPKSSPVTKVVIITLGMASGEEEIRYGDFSEADQFLEDHFGIKAPFDQM